MGTRTPRSTKTKPRGAGRDGQITKGIEAWFRANARELPWRAEVNEGGWRRDPYRSLVSEAMLQQTQVSRVIEKYQAFVERFPTIESLARASEHDVLAMWAGLGYYRRARNLHAAAKHVVDALDGEMPREIEGLRELPGVGAYTAGAIASMAGGEREALVDGNVVRVLLRIEGREGRVGEKDSLDWTWNRAKELVSIAKDTGVFNEGMMELGATVCVPGEPRCDVCPVRGVCVANAEGRQATIPAPKRMATRTRVCCDSMVLIDAEGRVMLEQRGDAGMWSKMWQAPTIERNGTHATRNAIKERVSALLGRECRESISRVGAFEHQTSHRAMSFRVWRVRIEGTIKPPAGDSAPFRVMKRVEAMRMPISNAQRRVLQLAGE